MISSQLSRYRIILLLVFGSVLGLTSSCDKYVRPKKVERIVNDNIWTVSYCLVNGVQHEFPNTEFHFREAGYIAVSTTDTVNGKWTVGLDKKPTTLYISAFYFAPYFVLNDNWEVLTADKNRLTLQADHGNIVNLLTLIRKED